MAEKGGWIRKCACRVVLAMDSILKRLLYLDLEELKGKGSKLKQNFVIFFNVLEKCCANKNFIFSYKKL